MTKPPVKKVVEAVLTGGISIFVPDIEVDFFFDEETGKLEECISTTEWRKVEDVIERLFPGYFKK